MKSRPPVSKMLVLLMAGLAGISGAAKAVQVKHIPPAPPSIPPQISTTYSNDRNRNGIDDGLESRAELATSRLKSSLSATQTKEAQTLLGGTVEVELIFKSQITQRQIDDFLARGGEIEYIYKAVSYGWNGRIPLREIKNLPSLTGATLALVQEAKPVVLHLDTATRTGRVRPVWAVGFAGNPSGFDGSDTITIALIDTGIDAGHSDLAGRQVYWHDFSSDHSASPVDIIQHGSHVAGIALGTGTASGETTGTLYCTDEGDLTGVSSGNFYAYLVDLPAVSLTYSSTAQWTGGGSTSLYHKYHNKGSSSGWSNVSSPATGTTPLFETNTFIPSTGRVYSPVLVQNTGGSVQDFVITSSITNYPGVGDGFNRLRGVAPGCNWAAAKVFTNSGYGSTTWVSSAIDTLVSTRISNNIKVMNLSLGAGIEPTVRQKVNTAVDSGIVVVVSAGNAGPSGQINDPGRAAMALTVAASNDADQLTDYSSIGFSNPSSEPNQEEDYKPDIIAPGGSSYYTAILSVDSGSGDGSAFTDQQSNDYTSMEGTSMSSPFAAGAAGLVIDAMQQQGITWDFGSSQHARYVKMVLCATASETDANRESGSSNPTLQRASGGPSGYPAGKDRFEGYGILNPDAAVEAVSLVYTQDSLVSDTLGPGVYDRRVWARRAALTGGSAFEPTLIVGPEGDFDLYLYSNSPSAYGTPIILASSTNTAAGADESLSYVPSADTEALLVVKRISGSGTFELTTQPTLLLRDLTITSTPGGFVERPGEGTFQYYYGTVVDLNAVSDVGWHFVYWNGEISTIADAGAAATTILIDANYSIEANFEINQYTINASTDGNGTVEPAVAVVDYGASQDFNAIPNIGYEVNEWLLDGNGVQAGGSIYTLTNVTAEHAVYVTFRKIAFAISGYVFEHDSNTPIESVLIQSDVNEINSVTDINGFYELIVDYNWSGKVTPTKYAYAFEPNSRYYQDVNQNYTQGQDYNGTLFTFRIMGFIKNECNMPIEGVSVDANNGGGLASTDVNGFYEVWVDYNWSGTVTPSRQHYAFEPNWMSYIDLLVDQADQNYIANNIYDLDCDGHIGLGDVGVMADNWLMTGPEIPGDFIVDETVNFLDFAEFGIIWQDR